VRIVGQRALAQQITGDASRRFAHQARERVRRIRRLAVSVRVLPDPWHETGKSRPCDKMRIDGVSEASIL